MILLAHTSDMRFVAGRDGVRTVFSTGDRKVELVAFENHTMACVKSALGYPAYYPVMQVADDQPVKAVLMDLDGTTVKSEEFWIGIIQMTIRSLLKSASFTFEDADIPFVSGHSVSEHLKYCIVKYCPDKKLTEAQTIYYEHTHREMEDILKNGKKGAFRPNKGVKDFLLALKKHGVKIGLVTSGLYEKAYPEILSAFREMELGDPKAFYDCIITAGFRLGCGDAGTMGELEAKPHPWLYAETAFGMGIRHDERDCVIGIEDSGAGVCSIRLAGFYTVGISGGNILQSGTKFFCNSYHEDFAGILDLIERRGLYGEILHHSTYALG